VKLQSVVPRENCKGADTTHIVDWLSNAFAVPVERIFVLDQDGNRVEVEDANAILAANDVPWHSTPLNFHGQWELKNGQRYVVNLATAAALNNIRVAGQETFRAGARERGFGGWLPASGETRRSQ
jgi:hypothetical protein